MEAAVPSPKAAKAATAHIAAENTHTREGEKNHIKTFHRKSPFIFPPVDEWKNVVSSFSHSPELSFDYCPDGKAPPFGCCMRTNIICVVLSVPRCTRQGHSGCVRL